MSFMYGFFLWLLIPLGAYLYKSRNKRVKQRLRWIILALLIIALARPVLFKGEGKREFMAHSVVLALDLSASMSAKDIAPSRILMSKAIIRQFLRENQKDQIALIGFTINPLLLSPFTTDHKLVNMALDTLNQSYILTKGSNLKRLFEKIAMLNGESKKVILFSDGGDEPIDEALISLVKRSNIELFVVAMATKEGSVIQKSEGELLHDKKGHIVVSKLNGSLVNLAKESGGEFMLFSSQAKSLEAISQWLEQKRDELIEKRTQNYYELAFAPLLLALFLFFLLSTHFFKKLVALLVLLGINLNAAEVEKSFFDWGVFDGYYLSKAYGAYESREYEKSLEFLKELKSRGVEAELLLAHIYYKKEEYKKAKEILEGIKTTNKNLKKQLFYEIGNCEFKLGFWRRAKENYIKALQLGEDEDALHNLTLVLFKEDENDSKIGFTNPSQTKKSSHSKDSVQTTTQKSHSSKKSSAGGSGVTGSKKSKSSTTKVASSSKKPKTKRVMSSKAYELINRGYINEEKPW